MIINNKQKNKGFTHILKPFSVSSHGERGFTLVETLVAISILTLSLLGTFTAVQNGLATSSFAKDQVTAFYLIQEAMEHVRNIRDENGLENLYSLEFGAGSSVGWLTGFSQIASDPCYFGKTCTIDVPLKTETSCSGSFATCPYIRQNSTTKAFGYSTSAGWVETKFRRGIQIEQISDDEIAITVQVSWTSGVFGKTVTVTQSLFDKN